VAEDEDILTSRIVALASEYGRYGYRRITAMLRKEDWQVNHKSVERIWRREGSKFLKNSLNAGVYDSMMVRSCAREQSSPNMSGVMISWKIALVTVSSFVFCTLSMNSLESV